MLIRRQKQKQLCNKLSRYRRNISPPRKIYGMLLSIYHHDFDIFGFQVVLSNIEILQPRDVVILKSTIIGYESAELEVGPPKVLLLKICHKVYNSALQKLIRHPKDQRYNLPLMLLPPFTILSDTSTAERVPREAHSSSFALELNFSVDKQGITFLQTSLLSIKSLRRRCSAL